MKNIQVATGEGALVSWKNKDGDMVAMPLLNLNKEWRDVGIYLKYGTSRSDPKYAAVFALPHDFKLPGKVRNALRRANA